MKKIIIVTILCSFNFLMLGQHRRVDSTVQIIILPAKPKTVEIVETTPKVSKLDSFLNLWIGKPYRYGGTTMKGIDCSGFVQKFYNEVFNLFIPRTAQTQYKAAKKVSKKSILAGDLLFFMNASSPSGWHVAVYLGNNLYIHAANKRVGVVMNELTSSVMKKIYAVGRFSMSSFDICNTMLNYKPQINLKTKLN